MEYSIQLSNFSGLDLTQVSIPLAVWNPKDADDNYASGTVLLDNVYFSD